ncbi:MAG: outer membrane protein assembly factor BamB [Gammaproteobacteria bacterium]|nr:outer membrane protein assembly factor BamB [Gammaproteobacteria bacterium]
MIAIRYCLLVLGFSLLTGCGGSEDNSEPPAVLTDFDAGKLLVEQWSIRTHSAVEQQFLFIEPLLLKDRVITAGRDGVVSIIDVNDGLQLQDITLDATLSSGIGGDENLWLLTTKEGELIAIDASTAETKWKVNLPSEALSRPVMTTDSILLRTVDGQILSLDQLTGKIRWSYQQTKPALTLRGSGLLVLSRDQVYAGMANGRMVALSLENGEVIWDVILSSPQGHSEIQRLVDVDGQAELFGYVLYVGGYQGRVAAIDVQKGQFLWARDFSTYSGVTVDAKTVYSSDERSHIWAMDRFSGATLWKQEKLQARKVTRPVLFGDYLVVGDADGYLHVLSKFDGHFVARVSVGGEEDQFLSENGVLVPPVVTDDAIIVTTRDGMLYSYTLNDLAQAE